MRVGIGLIALIIAVDIAAPDSGEPRPCKAAAVARLRDACHIGARSSGQQPSSSSSSKSQDHTKSVETFLGTSTCPP
jgi:hypothetical protein